MDKARKAAVAALVKVHRGGWSHLSLKNVLAAPSLSPGERAFAAALFYGVAERLVTLDYMLAPRLTRPVEKLDTEVRAILESGLYQMGFMNVPPRAAVDESVKLARGFGKTSAAGLVNAVLRRMADTPLPEGPFETEEQRVCVVYSVSSPVARAVMEARPDDYDAFFAASFSKPGLCLRTNTFQVTTAELIGQMQRRGVATRPGSLEDCFYAELPGGVFHDPLFENGLYQVQGEASQYAVACLGPQKGQRVLDLCAAPGGKTALAAMRMGLDGGGAPGAGVVACDVRENRVGLIRKNMERLGIGGVEVRQNDASVDNPALRGFDRVLCDVPCSGLGVLAKKPDLRYNQDETWAELEGLQARILENGAKALAPGGRLVYASCTLRERENADIVREFLAQNKQFRAVEPPVRPEGAVVEGEMMTIFPQLTGLDGFFVATIERL